MSKEQTKKKKKEKRGGREGETRFPSFVFSTLVLIPGGKRPRYSQMKMLAVKAKERRKDNCVEVTDFGSGNSC